MTAQILLKIALRPFLLETQYTSSEDYFYNDTQFLCSLDIHGYDYFTFESLLKLARLCDILG
jgi:hypothetical protein